MPRKLPGAYCGWMFGTKENEKNARFCQRQKNNRGSCQQEKDACLRQKVKRQGRHPASEKVQSQILQIKGENYEEK